MASPIDFKATPEGISVASGAILAALLEFMVRSGNLTTSEVRGILNDALQGLMPRAREPEGHEAARIIATILKNFPDRNV